jgi:hypothetical protein
MGAPSPCTTETHLWPPHTPTCTAHTLSSCRSIQVCAAECWTAQHWQVSSGVWMIHVLRARSSIMAQLCRAVTASAAWRPLSANARQLAQHDLGSNSSSLHATSDRRGRHAAAGTGHSWFPHASEVFSQSLCCCLLCAGVLQTAAPMVCCSSTATAWTLCSTGRPLHTSEWCSAGQCAALQSA